MSNKMNEAASELTEQFVKQLQAQITKQVQADVAQKLAQFDVKQAVHDYITSTTKGMIDNLRFPNNSISGTAIDTTTLKISGDNIVAGIIQKFGSTGIQDNATNCQVTILDNATVIENTLVAKEAEIKGNLTIDGDLILRGEIPTNSPFYKDLVEHSAGLLRLNMDGQFFLQYADKVFDKIKSNGLDISKLTMDGHTILEGNKLGYFITDTNIQKLGELKTLTVVGELTANETLFAKNKRVGINTEEPSAALSIWDEECEISIRKLRKDVSIIGSTRNQRVVMSSNDKNNLVLETDGSVSIEKLTIGAVLMCSAEECPRTVMDKGIIIFNESIDIGKPIGWVSLGGGRYATFGITS